MALFEKNSFEGKLVTDLRVHGFEVKRINFEEMAANIAFLIRHKCGPQITTNQISIAFTNYSELRHILVVVHHAPEKVDIVAQAGSDTGDLIARLNDEVDKELRRILEELAITA